jgi:ribonuclease HII
VSTVLGLDEAGRGPILGPLVLGAVLLDEQAEAALRADGINDSKAFGSGSAAHAHRSALAALVRARARAHGLRVADVAEIDRRVAKGELNVLERELARELIEALPPAERIIADGARLFAPLARRFPHLRARDKADATEIAVAAASILAKVRRDELFGLIAARYEAEFGVIEGGGYGNAATHAFLRRYVAAHGRLPPEARRSFSWASVDYLPAGYVPLDDRADADRAPPPPRQPSLALGLPEPAPSRKRRR